jgi:HB1, ASXL, restriction endonuclease HTH domain
VATIPVVTAGINRMPAAHERNTMTSKLSARAAVEAAMKGSRKPMRVPEIIAAAVPLSRLAGRTPGQTIYSVLYSESKKADGLVLQTGRGEFKLNPKRRKADASKPSTRRRHARKPVAASVAEVA